MRRAAAEYELSVESALSDLNNTMETEVAAHNKKCKQVHKASADSAKKLKAAEEAVEKKRKEFEQAAQTLARKIQKDTTTAVRGGASPNPEPLTRCSARLR